MKEIDTPQCFCLNCNSEIDTATGLEERRPKPGDYSLCLYCGHLMAFNDQLAVRELNDAEMQAIAGSPDLLYAQELALKFRKLKEAGKLK